MEDSTCIFDSGEIKRWIKFRDLSLENKLSEIFIVIVLIIVFLGALYSLILLIQHPHRANELLSLPEMYSLAFMEIFVLLFAGKALLFHNTHVYKRIILTKSELIIEEHGLFGQQYKIPVRDIVEIYTNEKNDLPWIIIIYINKDDFEIITLAKEHIPDINYFIMCLKRVLKERVNDTDYCNHTIAREIIMKYKSLQLEIP